jgi:hypothetical protein
MSHPIGLQPEVVGRLNPDEATAFSRSFESPWRYVKELGVFEGNESVRLLVPNINDNPYGVPFGYEQFLPAIGIAVRHEQGVRGLLIPNKAVLTVRQSMVRPGHSQQGGPACLVHRDINGRSGPARFYTVSDRYPTQYFPEIPSTAKSAGEIALTEAEERSAIEFDPYTVVHASAMVFHRSQTIPEGGLRTFLRLTFTYDPPEA